MEYILIGLLLFILFQDLVILFILLFRILLLSSNIFRVCGIQVWASTKSLWSRFTNLSKSILWLFDKTIFRGKKAL